MLDYAANAVAYGPVAELRLAFERTCSEEGVDAEERLGDFLGPDGDPEAFWRDADTNIRAGKIRMMFVADLIPTERRNVVEFLNRQMNPAEVLAVEVKQYVDVSGGSKLRTLVPTVFGRTAAAAAAKGEVRAPGRQWDEASFFAELEARGFGEVAVVPRRIIEWTRTQRMREWWGRSATEGSYTPVVDTAEVRQQLLALWPSGTVEVQFQYMKDGAFARRETLRGEFRDRLNAIPGVQLPDRGRPQVKYATLAAPVALEAFITAFQWLVDQVRAVEAG